MQTWTLSQAQVTGVTGMGVFCRSVQHGRARYVEATVGPRFSVTRADAPVIYETSVGTHVSNILSKLHLASRTRAALYVLREGLASLEDAPNS